MKLEHHIRPTRQLIAGLAKKIIPMRGEIDLPLQIGKSCVTHTYVVSDNIDNEFLMGMDLMKILRISIDIPNKIIDMPNNKVPFTNKPLSISNRMKLRCHKTTVIPAKTACFLQSKIPICNAKANYEGIIEPYHKLAETKGIFVTGTMSYSNKNLVPVYCINPMPWDVTIYKNQLIAFIEPYQPLDNIKEAHVIKKATSFYDASMDIPRLSTAEPVEVTREKGRWKNPEKLIAQLRIDQIDISEDHKDELKSLITEFSHCFSRNKHDLGCASFYEARITLKSGATPIWVPTRQTSYKMQPIMEKYINNLEKLGQISRCRFSMWNLPVFMILKPNGKSHRFLVDARSLNSQVIKDNYELPRINNILDKMTESKYWSNFDLTSSYTQIGLQRQARPYCAFTFNNKRYMFNRLIQGAINSSSDFSRAMSQLFSNTPFSSLCHFIDDLLMSSNTVEEHLKRLRFIFERLEWGNLKCSPDKTKLLARVVTFVGHTLSEKGLQVSDDKIKAINQLSPPVNVKTLQKFLGMVNYHRNHIKNFAQIANPLYNLLKKGTPFNWDISCQRSFDQLRNALTSAPILGIPDYTDKYESYEVVCDSSKVGHGATLSQWDGNQRRIIAYFSKSVPKHQQKLGATKLEMLGLLAALKHWRIYLHATKFVVKTDCHALLSMKTIFRNENSFMQRRLAELAGYDFVIKHISGASEEMKISDYLSRHGPFEIPTKSVKTQTGIHDNSPFDQDHKKFDKKARTAVKSQSVQTSSSHNFKESKSFRYDINKSDINLDYESDKIHPDYESEEIHPDYESEEIHPDYESEEIHPDYESEEIHPDYESEEIHPDYESEEIHPDYESEEIHPDYESEEIHPDYESEEIDSDYESEKIHTTYRLQKILLQSEENSTTPISTRDVQKEYANDQILTEVIKWVKNGKKPTKINSAKCHRETFHYWKNFNLLSFTRGILYIDRINPNTKKVDKVIVLPQTLIQRALYMFHNTLANCHPGADNSYETCCKKFYFYKMRNEFEMWVKACIICNKTKQTRAFRKAPLVPIIYNHFNQAISVDLLEPTKTPTPRRNVALLTITDMFTSYLVCVPVKSTSTEETIRNIIEHWFCRFGMCSTIHHDLGTNFTSKLFKAVLKAFQIKDKPGTSFHSQTQGKIESQNRRLNMCFRACLSDKDFKNYDLYAKYITFVLNSLKSVRTGYSAYFLVHGHEPVMPRDMFIEDNRLEKLQNGEVTTAESTAYELYRQMRDTARRVIIKTKQRAQYMATQYDKKVKGPFFEKGEYCLVLVNVPKHKFSEKWKGPYLITDKINDWNYIISIEGQEKIINVEKMKPYVINKYSILPQPTSPSKVENPIPTENVNTKSDQDSDSSSDEEFFITFSDQESHGKPDTKNNDQTTARSNIYAPTSHGADLIQPPSPPQSSSQGNLDNEVETAHERPTSAHNPDVTTSANIPEASTSAGIPSNSSESLNIPSSTELARSDDEDDQEAFYDANSSLDHQNTPATARDVTLSEIDKHGKKKGIKIPLPSGELSRSEAVDDLSGPSTSSHRSNTRYGLRPRVTGVRRYGSGIKSPVKALKKKITKSKRTQN